MSTVATPTSCPTTLVMAICPVSPVAPAECDDLQAQGYLTPDDPYVRQIDALGKQHSRLTEHGDARKGDLENTLGKLEALEDDLRKVNNDMGKLQDNIACQNPIGGDVGLIKQLQDEFKNFQRNEVEPVAREVDEANKKGSALIQSAAPGVNTASLEGDLEGLNKKWNDIQEKVS